MKIMPICNNYALAQNQQSFGAIKGTNFERGLEKLLEARFGAERTADLFASSAMQTFIDNFGRIKVALISKNPDILEWVHPVIDIVQNTSTDSFTIGTMLPKSINSKTLDIKTAFLTDLSVCLDQLLAKMEVFANELHQTDGHIINPFNVDFVKMPFFERETIPTFICEKFKQAC